MNLSDLFIDKGNNFTIRQLKERLNLIGILYDKEDVNKQTLVRLYDEALTHENNKRKILKDLIADTNARNNLTNKETINRREPINVEISKQQKFSNLPAFNSINLTSNLGSNNLIRDINPSTKNQFDYSDNNFNNGNQNTEISKEQYYNLNKKSNDNFASSNGRQFFNEKSVNELNDKNIVKGRFSNNLSVKGNDSMNQINNPQLANDNRVDTNYANPNLNLNRDQIERIKKFGNLNVKNSFFANNNDFNQKNTNNYAALNISDDSNQLQEKTNNDNRRSNDNMPNFSFGNTGNPNLQNRTTISTNDLKPDKNIHNPLIDYNNNNILKANSRNTLANFKNVDDFNMKDANFIHQSDKFSNNILNQSVYGFSNNLAPNRFSNTNLKKKNPLLTAKDQNEHISISNKNDNLAEKQFVSENEIIKNNFGNLNSNLTNMNSINNNIKDVLNQNYKGYDSINAPLNLTEFGNVNPHLIQKFNSPNNQSFGDNLNERNSLIPNFSHTDFNRETSFKINPENSYKFENNNIKNNLYPINNNNFETVQNNINDTDDNANNYPRFPNQNQPNSNDEQVNQQITYQNSNPMNIQENTRPFGRRSTQNIKKINNNLNQNNQLIDINHSSNDPRQFGFHNTNLTNSNLLENKLIQRNSTIIDPTSDSLIKIRPNQNFKQMASSDETNVPFEHPEREELGKAQNNSYFSEFRGDFFGLFLFALIFISLAGLNLAHVIDVRSFASRSIAIINEITPSNTFSLFEALVGIVIEIIQKIFTRILSLTGASIWNNIYLIIFLVFAVLVIRYVYLKIYYRRIAQEIFDIIKKRLREIRRANINDYRAGIRVDEIMNEFSQIYNMTQNAFRDNILPLLKNYRIKDEDIRSFSENEGGKNYEKWQYKGF